MIQNMSRLLAAMMLIVGGAVLAAEGPKIDTKAAEPAVGQPLPIFESTDDQGRPWKSTDHVGKKLLVLYFYPGDFTLLAVPPSDRVSPLMIYYTRRTTELALLAPSKKRFFGIVSLTVLCVRNGNQLATIATWDTIAYSNRNCATSEIKLLSRLRIRT
jgi:hypothetical protein